MNWKAIKDIYCFLLKNKNKTKIEYFGKDRYKLVLYYSTNEKKWELNYKNGLLHGKYTGWKKNGQKMWEQKYQDGTKIK